MREPIARRREREGKTFDTSHALAQAIMKGWKKGSPVDCLVISPAFEVMGGIDYNFFPECLGEFESRAEAYLFFLKASVEGKRPGLGTLVLTPEPTFTGGRGHLSQPGSSASGLYCCLY